MADVTGWRRSSYSVSSTVRRLARLENLMPLAIISEMARRYGINEYYGAFRLTFLVAGLILYLL